MNDGPITNAIAALIALTTGIAHAQVPAQAPGAGQQPAYAVASPPITSVCRSPISTQSASSTARRSA